MLGGAAYSYPQAYLKRYPHATMDVVEIDPKLTQLAKTYFGLKEDPRLRIYHEDGRVYLNTTTERYDAVLGDAFTSYYSVPYQLTTVEAVQKTYDTLADNGVVILNTISAIEGDHALFLRAEYATYKAVFPHVYLFPVDHVEDGKIVQNVILVALKSKTEPNLQSNDPTIQKYLERRWQKPIQADLPILTDDYAPVDHYMNKAL
jgi:spermidine synthase